MRIRLLLTLLAMLALASFVSAQEDEATEEPAPFEDLYSSVPTTRSESGAFTLGNPDAPVTVMEFADYLCPHCQSYHETAQAFIETYVLTGQAKFQYRFYLVIDPTYSTLGAKIAECAYEQGAFWTTHDELYSLAQQGLFNENLVTTVAENVGLDADALTACVEGEGPFQYDEDMLMGQDLGVSGTPAVRVQFGDETPGYLLVDGAPYDRGGASVEELGAFVTAANPSEFVGSSSVLNDDYLADDSLIELEDGCAPPCWNGITPGETDFAEAVEILREQEAFANIEVQSENGQSVAIFGDPLCCQMLTEDDTTVTFIQVRTAPTLTVSQVIEGFGEPTYLDGAPISRQETVMNLYYPDDRFIVFVYTPGEDVALNEASEIIGAVYFNENLLNLILENSSLHAWEGYLSWADYAAGEVELNPQ